MEKASSVDLCLMHSLLYELQNYHTAGFEERWKLEEQEKETKTVTTTLLQLPNLIFMKNLKMLMIKKEYIFLYYKE